MLQELIAVFQTARAALADGKLSKDECLEIARAALNLVTTLLGPAEAKRLVASMDSWSDQATV